MKTVKLNGKLKLNKETISELTKEQMNKLNGGYCIATSLRSVSCAGCQGTNNSSCC